MPDRQENFEDQNLDKWNDSSTLDEDEIDQMRRTGTGLLKTPENGKVAKADRKTAKHQAKIEVITENDLRELSSALHPDQAILTQRKRQDASQGLAQNAIENNIVFNTHTFKYYSLRTDVHNKKVIKANLPRRAKDLPDRPEQRKAFVDPVLQRLGLNSNLTRATKDRKALDVKLRVAIYNDILAITNEQAETMQRMAGYWRYVNRRTYNAMVRMNEIWDWATGAKLPEIEEENMISDIAESESDATMIDSTDLGSSAIDSPTVKVESNVGNFDVMEDTTLPSSKNAAEVATLTSIGDGAKTSAHPSVLQEADHVASLESDRTELLTYRPGRSPGPTLTFTVPSPSSSDEFWDGPDVSLEGDVEEISFAQQPNRQLFLKPSSMWAMGNARAKALEDKGHCTDDEVDCIVPNRSARSALKKNKQPEHHGKNLWPSSPTAKEIPVAKDLNNRFKDLRIETEAPHEEADFGKAKAPRPMSIKHLSTSSFSNEVVTSEDYPALSPARPSVETPRPKVISIGVTAVKLVDAKSKFSKKRLSSKTSGPWKTSTKGTWTEHTRKEAWTTVGNGKYR